VRTPVGPGSQLQPGDCLGEMSLVDGESRSATIVATTDLRVLVVDRSHFWRLLDDTPELMTRILTILSRRVRRLEARYSRARIRPDWPTWTILPVASRVTSRRRRRADHDDYLSREDLRCVRLRSCTASVCRDPPGIQRCPRAAWRRSYDRPDVSEPIWPARSPWAGQHSKYQSDFQRCPETQSRFPR
jgi:hypothetical protein